MDREWFFSYNIMDELFSGHGNNDVKHTEPVAKEENGVLYVMYDSIFCPPPPAPNGFISSDDEFLTPWEMYHKCMGRNVVIPREVLKKFSAKLFLEI